MKNNLRIAVIKGDGIGKEVVPEGLRVLEAAGDCPEIGGMGPGAIRRSLSF
jgi:tartrate dehydrogenase/decarboxylase / D-malate dehydrogenase